MLKQSRSTAQLTLKELGQASKVSPSYLGRIEQGKRFPSARVLHRIAKHICSNAYVLLVLAGYLSSESSTVVGSTVGRNPEKLDPYVAQALASEPVALQFTAIGVLALLKFIAKRG